MMKFTRLLVAVVIGLASVGMSVWAAAPASACTGDPCDSICYIYPNLPLVIQQKVFHSTSCPVL